MVEAENPVPGNGDGAVTGIHTDPVDAFVCESCGAVMDVSGISPFTEIACPACAATGVVPARLGNFLLLKLLGTGGMGGVYYARDEALGRFVAIKVMLRSLGDDPVFIETFRREAQAIARLNHPNIAQIYSFGQEKGQPYIVMELVSGERVDAMMEDGKPMRPAWVMRVALNVAQGLMAADEAGLVHGDIKPENILLDQKGNAKLVDFGLATVAHQAAGEGIWGTPYYIAPEKIRRQKVDSRADIYSLGATLFHMLTGKPPFEGQTPVDVVKSRLDLPPPDPSGVIPDLPPGIAPMITRMLAVDRAERYPNYLSLISDLRKILKEIGENAALPDTLSGGGGKHIRIKRRKSAPPPDPSPQEDMPEPVLPGTRGKRLVLRKDGPSKPVIRMKASKTPRPERTPEEIEARRQAARRRTRRASGCFLFLLFLMALGAGGTVLYQRRQEELARRAEFFALQEARRQSDTLLAAISNDAQRISVLADLARPMETHVQDAVERITGMRLEVAPVIAAEPEPSGPADEADITTNAAPTEASPPPETPDALPDGGDMPVAEDPDAPVPAVEAVSPEEEGGMDDASPPEPDHPVMIPARVALEHYAQLIRLHEGSATNRVEAMLARNQVWAFSQSTQTVAHIEQMKDMAAETANMAAEARTAYETFSFRAGLVREILANHERTMAAAAAAEREAQRRREEAEREERERQEYLARMDAELRQAQGDREEIVATFFAQNRFKDALDAFRQRAENYTTKEGREAIQVSIDRYTYLVRMKESLIAGMRDSPYGWGWGFGSTARDIEKADEKGIYVAGVRKPYPWSEVQTLQMLKLVDYYMESRTLRLRDRVSIAFGAAIYCDHFGPSARARAQAYANRAMDWGISRETFARLLEAGWL